VLSSVDIPSTATLFTVAYVSVWLSGERGTRSNVVLFTRIEGPVRLSHAAFKWWGELHMWHFRPKLFLTAGRVVDGNLSEFLCELSLRTTLPAFEPAAPLPRSNSWRCPLTCVCGCGWPIALKLCHMVGIWPYFILPLQKFGGLPPKNLGAKNMQNFGQFWTTSGFDREYLRNGCRYQKSADGTNYGNSSCV